MWMFSLPHVPQSASGHEGSVLEKLIAGAHACSGEFLQASSQDRNVSDRKGVCVFRRIGVKQRKHGFLDDGPGKRSRRRCGFSLIELLAVIAIIGVLAAILIPVIRSVRVNAGQSKSASNLRQIHNGLMLYAQDHNNRLPLAMENESVSEQHGRGEARHWFARAGHYLGHELPDNALPNNMVNYPRETVFSCPNFPSDHPWGPYYVAYGISRDVVDAEFSSYDGDPLEQPGVLHIEPNTIIVADAFDNFMFLGRRSEGERMSMAYRHNGEGQALMMDGSVRVFQQGEEIPEHLLDPGQNRSNE